MPDLLERLKSALGERYAVDREIGRGGMATVYLAEDLKHHRLVAIKVLHPELAASLGTARFLREIETVAGFDHPHVLPLYDSGEADGLLYFVMPYVEGESLRERLEREGQLPVDQALGIAAEVADGLAYAHARAVVHRDIKPGNILLSAGHARISDFGVARAIGVASGGEATATGLAVGTAKYMSPEQAAGGAEIDGRTDIYALGCVLWEMLAGEPPWDAPTPHGVLARKATEEPPEIRVVRKTVPPSLENVLAKAMATSPADRFQTAGELATALQAPETVGQVRRRGARKVVHLTIGAVTVAAVVAGTWIIAGRSGAEAGAGFWLYDRAGERAKEHAGSSAATSIAEPAAVAVLPFVALSAGADDGYFADGLTEETINALAALPDLLVTARTSAFYFKGKDVPVPEIAEALGVAHVVEGTVRRFGAKVRITAQLIRAADGFNLWSAKYDRSLDDVFAVQTEIAESVAGALGVLLDEQKRALMADVGVRDVEAFTAYQRGVELFNRAHNEGPLTPLLARANTEFEAAIARKPDFAHAYFQHADYYAHLLIDEAPGRGAEFMSTAGVGVDEAARRLEADLDAAFRYERDPNQRLVIQVVHTIVSDDWRSLKQQITRAYDAWDNCRHGLWIDQTAITFGLGEAVLAHDLRRERCDPLGGNWTRTAITAVWIGRPLDGLEYAERIEAQRGQDRDVMHARILAYLALGQLDEAEALFAVGNFGATDVSEAMSLLALQIPAAAGRAAEWEQFRSSLERDPGRLIVGAAVFGDRATANRAAAEIDGLMLGPSILLRITDRCGCGAPFDLDATPNFARLLREGELPWSPPAPIKFPLKSW